ncbi:5-hydroxytryptamine receptor 6-like [Python bivittatus]|uniref:5-hydroxytryptamine receptor 6-like n=1 Tax=Python bivittatus TaxID=176946 RepID=A0A9F5J9V1_PYTBI|nr:5-hydroxytryptamine receptor 6-like [Python bivittatus]
MFFFKIHNFFFFASIKAPRGVSPRTDVLSGEAAGEGHCSDPSRPAVDLFAKSEAQLLFFLCPPLPSPPSSSSRSVQAVCNCISGDFFDLLTWLGYCNSTMNPIIYPLFMRDFKRAMARYLPCCPRAWEHRPSRVSLSLRNSNSGPRPGVSLKNTLTLPGETDSSDSVIQGTEHSGQRLSFLPAMRADSVNLSDPEQTEQELKVIYLNTPTD